MLGNIIFTAFLAFVLHNKGINGYNLTIKTENGYVKGFEETSASNKSVTYFAFKGVPYGEPTVGSLRFQDPRPVSSWDGIKEVTDWADYCVVLETSLEGNPVVGSEDCLYLNIYVPKTEKANDELSLPVMVWYHGGGFVRGDSRPNPSYYIEKPVIIAAVSYRLGIMGFLSTLDENARGNAGLKDQTLGLKWIKDNIRYFGGDPDRITIFGQSAGGASIEYQLISERSTGLFSQAISQSGSTLNEWGFQEKPLELTLKLAKRFNITSNDTKEVVAGLQKIDMEVLVKNSQLDGKFLPSVEAESDEAFIDQSSYDLWATGKYHKVPFLVGYNSEEGANNKNSANIYAKDPKNVIPAGLHIDKNSSEAEEVVEAITKRYFPGYSYNNFTNCINFMTQHHFVRGIRMTIGDFANSSVPLYFYKFTYVTKEKYTKGVNGGAGHAEEGKYTWHSTTLANEDDIRMKDRMVTLWTNFAIYGNPTPTKDELLDNVIWPEAHTNVTSQDDLRYLELGYDLVPGISPDQEDYLFWRGIFQKYATTTIYTY